MCVRAYDCVYVYVSVCVHMYMCMYVSMHECDKIQYMSFIKNLKKAFLGVHVGDSELKKQTTKSPLPRLSMCDKHGNYTWK